MGYKVVHEVTTHYYGAGGVEYPPGHRFDVGEDVPPTCRTRPVPVYVPDPPAAEPEKVSATAGHAAGGGKASGRQ